MNFPLARRRVWLGLSLLPLAVAAQNAEPWPSRPITLVVASAAGSGVDLLAREMAQKLSAVFKQPVIVDNKPGASGILAGTTVARARPDGYTFLYSTASFTVVAPALIKKMAYDPVKDLTPVAQTAIGGIILMVNKDIPANNLKELVALVKANPNKFSYGTWGTGSSGHLTTEWLKMQAGLKMDHVPYKATTQVVTELASGVLPIAWSDPGTPVPMLESKQLKGIAISGNARVPRTPQIATMTEQGYPFDAVGWFGIFGPANLPVHVTERMNQEINKVQQSPEVIKRLEEMNFERPPVRSVMEFKATIAKDLKIWQSIVSDAHIKLD